MNNCAKVREHLEQITANASVLAADAAGNYIAGLSLDSLSDGEKIIKVHDELLALKKEIENFNCPEYIFY